MTEQTLKVLSANSPKNVFHAVRSAAARIASLERSLNLEPSQPIFNVAKAKARISQLEQMLAASKAAPDESARQLQAAVESLRVERAAAPVVKADEITPPADELRGELRGRARFAAAAKVETAKVKTAPVGTKGRAKFCGALAIEGQK